MSNLFRSDRLTKNDHSHKKAVLDLILVVIRESDAIVLNLID